MTGPSTYRGLLGTVPLVSLPMATPTVPLMQSSVFAAVFGLLSVILTLASCAVQSWYQVTGVVSNISSITVNYNVGLYNLCTSFSGGFQSIQTQCSRWLTDFNNIPGLPSAIPRARDGGISAIFFLSLSMVANILLVVVAIMTALSFGGSPKACGGLSSDDPSTVSKRKISTIVVGIIACISSLIGAIVGWATLSDVSLFYFSAVSSSDSGNSFNRSTRTLTAGPGAILAGFAVTFNFAAFFLALLPFYLTPFKALQPPKYALPSPSLPPPMPAWAGPSNPLPPPPPPPPEQQWKAFSNGEKPYYFNAATGETVWELPAGVQVSSTNPLSNAPV